MKAVHKFYKDDEGWFIDLPEFLEAGLGTKANLAMVAGADTLLDKLSNNGNNISLIISDELFDGFENELVMTGMGADVQVLEEYGHPIQFGGYYKEIKTDHLLWLCPVTVYVFGGHYPKSIFLKIK
jgi:predicted alpha/beta-hydrolase family hydrolase